MAGTNKGSTFVATYGTSSPVQATAPTDINDGQPLDGLTAVQCAVASAAATTLAGTGGVCVAYLLDPAVISADGAAAVNMANGSGLADTALLAYDAQSANFTLGLVLTGTTSGAKGTISADTDAGTTGVLTLTGVHGLFLDNETITDSSTGAATANGVAYKTVTYDGLVTAFEVGMTVRDKRSNASGVVSADSGTVLTLTWTADFGVFADNDPIVGVAPPRWVRWVDADLPLPTDQGALRTLLTKPYVFQAPRKCKGLWIPDGVELTAGSAGVTIYQCGQASAGLHDAGKWGG